MLTGTNTRGAGETRSSWRSDGALDEWFTESTHQLRQRTAREGAWVKQPTRETVERIINWLHNGQPQTQQ
jgi:hypothetical protein